MNDDIKQEEKDEDSNDEEEVAIALIAECQVGDKKYKAGETWTDQVDECRMSICNPGGVVSYLGCPRFDAKEGDPAFVTIPGDKKYVYPHCCDYVFHTKEKNKKKEEEESENTEEPLSV